MINPPTQATEKILERRDDLKAAGWTKHDLFHRGPHSYSRHGLAWYVQDHNDLGEVTPESVELLGRRSGSDGERSKQYYRKHLSGVSHG